MSKQYFSKSSVCLLLASLLILFVIIDAGSNGNKVIQNQPAAPLQKTSSPNFFFSPRTTVDASSSQPNSPLVHSEGFVPLSNPTAEVIQDAVARCNQDRHNNPGQHISCLLIKNAAVFPDGSVRFAEEDNPNIRDKKYPSVGKTRYFLREAPLIPVPRKLFNEQTSVEKRVTNVAIYQHPVSGAAFDNVWHTLSDFAFTMFDTISPFVDFAEEETEKAADGFTLRKFYNKSLPSRAKNSKNNNLMHNFRAPLTWLLLPPAWSNFRDVLPCRTAKECKSKVLFEPFAKFFASVVFVKPSAANDAYKSDPPLRFDYLIVGMATSCSPVPMQGVGTPRCKESLRKMRDHLLMQYGFNPFRKAFAIHADENGIVKMNSEEHEEAKSDFLKKKAYMDKALGRNENDVDKGETKNHTSKEDGLGEQLESMTSPCPSIHVMSRQFGKYRRMFPWEAILSSLKNTVHELCMQKHTINSEDNKQKSNARSSRRGRITSENTVNDNTTSALAESKVVSFSLSKTMTFREQLATIANQDFLIAGRGGGTGLSIFLPLNGVYLSVSGSDRWNPYRDLEPPWLKVIHYEAKLVDPKDPSHLRNCPPSKKGGVDANKCDYWLAKPQELGEIVARETLAG